MEEEGIAKVKMLTIITASYLIFWGPLYLVTVWNWDWSWVEAKNSIVHEVGQTNKRQGLTWSTQVSLHISFCHSMVTPLLYLVLHPGLRKAAQDMFCCYETSFLLSAGSQSQVRTPVRSSGDKR